MKTFLSIVLVFAGMSVFAQSFELFSGINYGGALPSEKLENTKGSGCIGLSLGVGAKFIISEKLVFAPAINYELRRFKYSSQEKKDTLVSVEMFGSPAQIPTYYTAYVSGKPTIHYASFSLPLKYYYTAKLSIDIGVYYSFAIFGIDNTQVIVKIGEGGLIPDQYIEQKNWDKINKHEFGFSIGGTYYLSEKIDISFKAHRSITPFYCENHIKNSDGENVNFYSTGIQLTINYQIPLQKE
jgi:hypothetical protein